MKRSTTGHHDRQRVCFCRDDVAQKEVDFIKGQVFKRTGLRTLAGANITKWIYKRLPEAIQPIMHAENKSGLSLDESTRLNLLEVELPSDTLEGSSTVEEVVSLIESAQSSSTAKLGAWPLAQTLKMIVSMMRLRIAGLSRLGVFLH